MVSVPGRRPDGWKLPSSVWFMNTSTVELWHRVLIKSIGFLIVTPKLWILLLLALCGREVVL